MRPAQVRAVAVAVHAAVAAMLPVAAAVLPVPEATLPALEAVPPVTAAAGDRPPTFSIQTNVVATDNGAFAEAGARRADLIAWTRPSLAFHRHRPELELDLDAGAVLLGSARGTQPGDIQPDVTASAKSFLLDRWLGLDARAQLQQTPTDLFDPRPDDVPTRRRRTQSSYEVAAHLERDLTPNLSLAARQGWATTANGAGAGRREVNKLGDVVLKQAPVPWGGALEWTRSDARASDDQGLSRITVDSLRATANIRVGADGVVGATAGRDRSRFLLSEQSDPLYGVEVGWDPSPRTHAALRVEHRFFGVGGLLEFRHRNPFLAIEIVAGRTPATLSSSLGLLGAQGDLRSLLDAALTTRLPDATTRAGAVDRLVNNLGINTGVSVPTYLVAAYPRLQTSFDVRLALLGRRQTVSFAGFYVTARQLVRDGDLLTQAVPAISDSRQWGAGVQWNHRLTEQLSAGATLRWRRVQGLALRAGEESREVVWRASLRQALSPRTSASIGVQADRFSTNAAGLHPYTAAMIFVGVDSSF